MTERMTDQEVLAMLDSNTPLNLARQEMTAAWGKLVQATHHRRPPSPVEIRRMEFEAVRQVAAALGVQLNEGGYPVMVVRKAP